jgi:hypothetical protein
MIRDTESKALIETDVASLYKYRVEKKKLAEFDKMKTEISNLKQQIANVNQLLEKIMEEKF